MRFKAVFQPIKIGNMEIRNRFVVPPMGTNYANSDSTVSQRLIDYHAERAKGGFGLNIVEVTAVSPTGKAIINQPGLWNDDQIDGYRRLAEVCHEHGAKVAVQLHHAGRQTMSPNINGMQPVSSSPIPCPVCKDIPREMTTEEVYEMIENFIDAAERAKKANIDAVEVHGAHGYLIAQFMSAYSNKRVDEFGGSFENRMRFPLMIIKGIRRRLGNGYPILFRISGDEKVTNGRNIAETRAICKLVEEAGVDALHVTSGVYGSQDWIFGASDFPVAYMTNFTEEVKKTVSLPVITAGRINEPHIAEELVASGRVDMVSIGRQSIADPHFPNKILSGMIDEIAPCIGCHQGCSEQMFIGNLTSCVVNPFVGKEQIMKIQSTLEPKNVMIVGGGPAGLEAAWILAKRGHNVKLYEKGEHLGGQFRIAAYPPGKGDLTRPIRYYHHMGEKFGVTYHMNTEVTSDIIENENPDVLILATGSKALLPKIDGIDNKDLLFANDVLLGKSVPGQKVLIAGGGMVGSETADFLAEHGHQVTILEMYPEIARDVNAVVKIGLMKRIKEYGVNSITNATIKQFYSNGVSYEQNGEVKDLHGFDSIVLALGAVAYNPLEEKAKGKAKEIYVIGDAEKAGKVLNATTEAAKLAISI